MIAEIISIGDELLLGQTINTNASWMGEQLHIAGIYLQQVTTISDERAHILTAIAEAEKRADLIIMTGGLGPTKDDITKQTLCEYFNTSLVINEEVLRKITAYFTGRGLVMLEVNKQQAALPKSAEIIENTRGTAMGMWFTKGNKNFISLPGVPHEMKGMMLDKILPILKERFDNQGSFYQVIQTVGVGESFIAEKIKGWETRIREEGLGLAYLPSPGIVKLRVSGPIQEEDRVKQESSKLEALLGEIVFGKDQITLSEALGNLLRNQKSTLAVAESCTGGYLGHLLTAVSGSSDYFKGGVISYTNSVKSDLLKVNSEDIEKYGAVSEEVVKQMAVGVRKLCNSTYGLATSGVAGPNGGSAEKPVGTVWIAVSDDKETTAWKFTFGKSRERNISISAIYALNRLRLHILQQK
jgi:nicotinamide-nucleotide amidase